MLCSAARLSAPHKEPARSTKLCHLAHHPAPSSPHVRSPARRATGPQPWSALVTPARGLAGDLSPGSHSQVSTPAPPTSRDGGTNLCHQTIQCQGMTSGYLPYLASGCLRPAPLFCFLVDRGDGPGQLPGSLVDLLGHHGDYHSYCICDGRF